MAVKSFTLILFYFFIFIPCYAESRPSYGGRARTPLSETPVVDPLAASDGARQIGRLVFDTLFTCPVSATQAPQPRLALALIGADTLRPTIKLRAGVTLHDGRILSAADVAASLTRALRSSAAWLLAPILSARATGADTVELQLGRPTPELPLLLCSPVAAIAVPSAKGKGRPAVGTGPFVVAELDARHVVLRAFAAHFAGRPYLDELIGRVVASRTEEAGGYELGLLELSRQGPTAFAGGHPKHPFVVVDSDPSATTFLAIGQSVAAAARPNLAAALAALDRRRIARSTAPPFIADDGPTAPSPPVTAPRSAVKLLIDGGRFEDAALNDRLLAELARVGVDASIERAQPRDFIDRLSNGRFEVALATTSVCSTDPGLNALALVAAVDPRQAQSRLLHAAALPDMGNLPVLILGRRAARLWHDENLQLGLGPDGTVDWANAYFAPALPRAPAR